MAINPVKRQQSVFELQHQLFLDFIQGDASKCIHPHQQEALLAVKRQLDDIDQPNIALVVLPTGCGKTGVAVLAPYVLGSRRVLVLTPSNAVSEQIFKAFGGQESQDMFFVQRKIITKDTTDDVRPSCTLITSTDQIKNSLHNELLIITAHQVAGSSRVKIQDIFPENYDLVIVDEAHHYPAPTWRTIVNHFSTCKRLFLTATPYHRSTQGYILKDIEAHLAGLDGKVPISIDKYFNLSLHKAIDEGVIREKEFHEVGTSEYVDELDAMQEVSIKIIQILCEHDKQDPNVKHQAMVLTQTAEEGGINSATDFFHEYNEVAPPDYQCEMYIADSPTSVLTEFQNGATRTLVIVNKLREGYDNTNVSVAAIVRNVGPKSRVLFAQFVGRAIRKAHPDDPVTAVIIAHKLHKQRDNYEQFDSVADEDVIVN